MSVPARASARPCILSEPPKMSGAHLYCTVCELWFVDQVQWGGASGRQETLSARQGLAVQKPQPP
eukprot:192725-Lingulodinium_polyedra.AAC.1